MSVTINIDPLDNNAAIKNIGNAIMGYEPLRNAYYETIINKFALSILFSKEFTDQYSFMDRGMLRLGETVEGIYVDIAQVMGYDPDKAEGRELKRYDGDVHTAYASMNWQKLYPISISEENARMAFMSWEALGNFIRGLVESLYNAMRYDHSIMKHYAICRAIVNGAFPAVSIADMTDVTTAQANTISVRAAINDMTLVQTKYNPAGVHNFDSYEDLYIITDNINRAYVDVMVDANAFNLEKVNWLGHVITSWPFYQHDEKRLAELIEDYEPFTDYELTLLKSVPFVVVARDAMEMYINHREMGATPVRSGVYTNYFLNDWDTLVMWPWAQRMCFTTGDSSITSVAISPTTATLTAGASMMFDASVTASGVIDKSVTYSVTGNVSAKTKILGNQLIVGKDETATTLTVTATCDADTGKTAKATVTVKSA